MIEFKWHIFDNQTFCTYARWISCPNSFLYQLYFFIRLVCCVCLISKIEIIRREKKRVFKWIDKHMENYVAMTIPCRTPYLLWFFQYIFYSLLKMCILCVAFNGLKKTKRSILVESKNQSTYFSILNARPDNYKLQKRSNHSPPENWIKAKTAHKAK